MRTPNHRLAFSLLAAVCGWLAVAPQPGRAADAPTAEERLRRLEATVDLLQKENAELKRLVGKPAGEVPVVNAAGKETKLVIGGFTQGQAEFGGAGDARFAGVNDRIYFRRARIALSGSFAEHFDFKIEGDFGANSLSAGTGLRAQANEIFLNWNRYAVANIRLGQLKPAFGAEQLMSDTKTPTIERFFANDRLVDGRQLAVGLYGELPNKRISYIFVVGQGNGSNVSTNDNNKFLTSARVVAVAVDDKEAGKLTFGANAMHSEDNAISKAGLGLDSIAGGAIDNLFVGRRDTWGVDAAWHRDLLDLSAEYIRANLRPANRIPAGSFNANGWHATAGYFVVPGALQAVVRREQFDPNNLAGGDRTENWVLGLNYLIKGDDIKLMTNYITGKAAGLPNDHGRWITRMQIIY